MSRVIKSISSADANAVQPYVLRPADMISGLSPAEEEVQDIVTKAKQQVEIILHTARADAKSVVDEAYAEGYKAGTQQAAAAADQLLARLDHDIAEVAREKETLIETVEPELLKLCLECVEKIIRHEIKTDPRVVMRIVKFCLRRVKDRDEVFVRVSPQEVEQVRAQRDELISVAEGVRGLSIVDDRRVSPGGCVVESPSGDLDARIEIQIEQIRRKLMETFNHDRGGATSEPDEISRNDQQDGRDQD